MTPAEARAHLQQALDAARPQCFVPVSAQALAVVLEERNSTQGERDERQEETD